MDSRESWAAAAKIVLATRDGLHNSNTGATCSNPSPSSSWGKINQCPYVVRKLSGRMCPSR